MLSRHEEVAQGAQVVRLGQAGGGVVPLDGPDGGGRGEKAVDPVGLDDAEELARVRSPCVRKVHDMVWYR